MNGRWQLLVVWIAVAACAGRADAGGLGVVDLTGFHIGADTADPDASQGTWLDQSAGVEVQIGSRASRVGGRVRVLYNYVHPTEAHSRHFGVALFGLEVQLLKDLQRPFGIHLHWDIGPAFLAHQHEEYGLAMVGFGLHRDLGDHVVLCAEVSGQLRFRKRVWGGAVASVALRFPFD